MTTATGSGLFSRSGRGVILAKMLRRHHADAHVIAADDLDAIPRRVMDPALRVFGDADACA